MLAAIAAPAPLIGVPGSSAGPFAAAPVPAAPGAGAGVSAARASATNSLAGFDVDGVTELTGGAVGVTAPGASVGSPADGAGPPGGSARVATATSAAG